MTELEVSQRLAHIRAQWLMWSALTDTSAWDVTFLLSLIDGKNEAP